MFSASGAKRCAGTFRVPRRLKDEAPTRGAPLGGRAEKCRNGNVPHLPRASSDSIDVTLLVLVVEIASDGTDPGSDQRTGSSIRTE